MSHKTRWSRVPVSLRTERLALIPLLGAVLWLTLAGTAFASYSTNPGWYWLNPLPAGPHTWVDVAMCGDEAWTTSGDLTMLHSTDSGRTWKPLVTDARHLDHVTFVSPTVGWADFAGTTFDDKGVVRTTDGGHTWTRVLPDSQPSSSAAHTDVFALDAMHAWVSFGVGSPTFYRTTNGGVTWTTPATPVPFQDVVFTSATDGWSVGNPQDDPPPHLSYIGTIYHTTDAGDTWSEVHAEAETELYSIAAPVANHIVAGGRAPWGATVMEFASVVVRSSDHGATWSTSYPESGNYDDRRTIGTLVFSDSDHGWAASTNYESATNAGTVMKTTDGGATWTPLSTQGWAALACNAAGDFVACDGHARMGAPAGSSFASVDPSPVSSDPTVYVSDLCFVDGERGFAVFGNTSLGRTVARTTNGGGRWDMVTLTAPLSNPWFELNSISAQSPSHLWAVGDHGAMARSTDSGSTWAVADSTTSQDLTAITFADADNGWAAGGGSLISTVDGGESWNPDYVNGDHSWSGVACASTTNVCAAGVDNIATRGCVVRTTNGGDTWRQVLTSSSTFPLDFVAFRGSLDGWAGGYQGKLYRTANGGATWAPCDLSGCFTAHELTVLHMRDAAFTSASTGYVVGDINPGTGRLDGYLLTTTDGGTTWAKTTTVAPGLGLPPQMQTLATSGARVWMGGIGPGILANFDLDPNPPVTTDTYDGRWTGHPVTLDFSATDPGVGVAYTRYRRWPDAWVYGASVTVPAPGDHSHDGVWPVRYQSVDWLAQAESPHTRLVKIDTVAPTDPGVALFPDPALTGGFVGPNPTFCFRGLDSAPASGVPADSSMVAVAVAGPFAYVGDGDSLVVFDVSNPWQPQYVSEVGLHGVVSDVAVAHDLACVATGPDGLWMVDVTDPAHPEVVGSCAIDGDASRVSRDGEFAYVATGNGGVVVVNVHHPDAPDVVTTLKVEGATDLAADGDRLCVVTDAGLTAFDLSVPEEPAETGSCALHHGALGVDLRSGLACAAGPDGAWLVEALGEAPEVLANLELHGSSTTAALAEDLAMVGGDEGVAVLDVSDPAVPVLAGTIAPAAMPLSLAADGEYVYSAEGGDGLEIWKAMATEAASYLVDHAPATVPDTVAESGVGSASFSGLAGGSAYFHVRTRDQAGNWGAPAALAFTVDAAPPDITTNADGVPHHGFTLLLSANDHAGSGVASVEYRVDGGPWRVGTSVTFRGSIRHKLPRGHGTHVVEYRATDRVGNVSSGSCEVRIL